MSKISGNRNTLIDPQQFVQDLRNEPATIEVETTTVFVKSKEASRETYRGFDRNQSGTIDEFTSETIFNTGEVYYKHGTRGSGDSFEIGTSKPDRYMFQNNQRQLFIDKQTGKANSISTAGSSMGADFYMRPPEAVRDSVLKGINALMGEHPEYSDRIQPERRNAGFMGAKEGYGFDDQGKLLGYVRDTTGDWKVNEVVTVSETDYKRTVRTYKDTTGDGQVDKVEELIKEQC